MFHPAGLATLLTLGLLAERVLAAPAPTPRGDVTVSSLCHYFVNLPEWLGDFLGRLRELRS